MQQIDRMQTLIELKSVSPATAVPQSDATACDTTTPQHAINTQNNDNKKENGNFKTENVAVPQSNATTSNNTMPQHATLQNVAMPQPKKRGLFGRVMNAVFNDD